MTEEEDRRISPVGAAYLAVMALAMLAAIGVVVAVMLGWKP